MDKQWKLGVDVHERDNLLDNITFLEVIEAVQHGEQTIDENAVMRVVKQIMDINLQDMNYLLKVNMDAIIKAAKGGATDG